MFIITMKAMTSRGEVETKTMYRHPWMGEPPLNHPGPRLGHTDARIFEAMQILELTGHRVTICGATYTFNIERD